jgi:hypothetical protein
MAVTFPTSPTDGQTFTANGLSYVYNSTYGVWRLNVSAGGSSGGGGVTTYATVAELPLTNNTNGDMAFVEETDRLYLSNDNAWYNIALINTNPTITSGSAGSYDLATDGTPTVITLVANDPEEVPLTWSYTVTSGALGTTATVSQADNVFTITPGTDAANDGGTFQLTFSVTDGTNIVNDVSSFTLNFVTAIENSNYTLALITANNLSGTIDDASSSNNTINTVGSPELTTFSPYRSGGYSVEFNGTDSALTVPASTSLQFETGDFTVEAWIYTDHSDFFNIWQNSPIQGGANSTYYFMGVATDGSVQFYQHSGGPGFLTASSQVSANVWTHIAFTRHNGTSYIYVDGIERAQSSVWDGYSFNQSYNNTIGYRVTPNYASGYISDLRVVKGTAVYTADFTPPTERLEAITNTSLLTCHLPYIADSSTNDHAITINGSPSIKPFVPYDYDTFAPADHGGSIYFNGAGASGDSVWVGNNTILSSLTDWTLDWWMYPTSITHNTPNYATVFSASLNGTVGNDLTDIYIDGTNMALYYYSQGAARVNTGANSIKMNQWYHVAISRTGSTMTLFLNGKAVDTDNAPTNPVDSYAPYIGDRLPNAGSANYPFEGYISDMRLHRHGMYTSDFTPPTQVTASTSTPVSLQATRFHLATNTANTVDKSQSTRLTLGGNAAASTAQYKYSTHSIAFDGTGDYLEIPYSDEIMRWWDTDYTMEYWIRANAFGQTGEGKTNFMTHGTLNSTTDYWSMGPTNSGGIKWFWWSGTTNEFFTSTAITLNTWHHLAFVYDKSTTTAKIYIDGTLEASTTVSTTPQVNSSYPLYIGHGANAAFNGYIEDFRISKGLARYSTNFTPPSAALDG